MRGFRLRPSLTPAHVRPLLRMALPVWPALLAGMLYLKLDALMVSDARHLGRRRDLPARPTNRSSTCCSARLCSLTCSSRSRRTPAEPGRPGSTASTGAESEVLLAATLPPFARSSQCRPQDLTTSAYDPQFEAAAGPMALLGIALRVHRTERVAGARPARRGSARCQRPVSRRRARCERRQDRRTRAGPAFGPIGAAWGTLVRARRCSSCCRAWRCRATSAHDWTPGAGARRRRGPHVRGCARAPAAVTGVNRLLAIVLAATTSPAWSSRARRPTRRLRRGGSRRRRRGAIAGGVA